MRTVTSDRAKSSAARWQLTERTFRSRACGLGMLAGVALLLSASVVAAEKVGRMPSFADFSVTGVYTGPRAAPILDTPDKYAYRTRIRNAAKLAPNFAGGYVLEYWGCGTSCTSLVVINSRTGEVFIPSFGAQGGESLYKIEDADKFERLQWRINSRLIVINGRRNEEETKDAHHFYEFDGRGFRHIVTIPGKPVAESVDEPPPPAKSIRSEALPYVGRWAARNAACRDPESDAVRVFEVNALLGYESRCEFRRIERVGETWNADGTCEGEGEKWTEALRFSVEGDTMVMQKDKDKPVALLRCER